MYRIAIVEDNSKYRTYLRQMLNRYQSERAVTFQIQEFYGGVALIAGYKPEYDVILLDIEMPHMTGMEVARAIRKADPDVCLIFVTYMAGYAIEGYEVRALDFILKPVEYTDFAAKLNKALELRARVQKKELVLVTPEGMHRVLIDDIYYVEIINHTLVYHTSIGDLSERGAIKDCSEKLKGYGFSRCNNSFLVNLQYVQSVSEGRVIVKGRAIPIGRTKKKEFMQELTEYLGDHI